MKQQKIFFQNLREFIDSLQSKGRYTFSREEVFANLKLSKEAYNVALNRQIAKKRIAKPRNGFYVIIPIEYKDAGAPPASWFIDDLMKFQKQPYYVALLSAAALNGAAHQQPQEFQIMTNKPLRPITIGRNRIRFFKKNEVGKTATVSIKTTTGYMQVASPESTAFDLVRYVEASGYLNNVATVISELIEKINEKRLVMSAENENIELTIVQRTGFLLDYVGGKNKTLSLSKWLLARHPRTIPLNPTTSFHPSQKNQKWRVYVNDNIEIDVLTNICFLLEPKSQNQNLRKI